MSTGVDNIYKTIESGLVMARGRKSTSPEGNREIRWEVKVTRALDNRVERFKDNNPNRFFRSRNNLIEVALDFFMQKYIEADGHLNDNYFPLIQKKKNASEPKVKHPPKKTGTD